MATSRNLLEWYGLEGFLWLGDLRIFIWKFISDYSLFFVFGAGCGLLDSFGGFSSVANNIRPI
jgi:hypothetical protein